MGYGTGALVVVYVGGGGKRDVVLDENVLPRDLQRLEHGALDLAGMLQRKVGARRCIKRTVRREYDPGSD